MARLGWYAPPVRSARVLRRHGLHDDPDHPVGHHGPTRADPLVPVTGRSPDAGVPAPCRLAGPAGESAGDQHLRHRRQGDPELPAHRYPRTAGRRRSASAAGGAAAADGAGQRRVAPGLRGRQRRAGAAGHTAARGTGCDRRGHRRGGRGVSGDAGGYLAIAAAIVSVHIVVAIVLRYSTVLIRILGVGGITLLAKIAGLLLAAIAVQLIADSVAGFIAAGAGDRYRYGECRATTSAAARPRRSCQPFWCWSRRLPDAAAAAETMRARTRTGRW